jgi:WD40 repeat protein
LQGFQGHTGAVNDLKYRPDEQRIATASADGTAKLWDAHSGECLITFADHQGQVWSAAFAPFTLPNSYKPSQLLATSSMDCTIKLWNLDTGECIQTLEGHEAEVRAVAFHLISATTSKKPQLILASGSLDETIRIWDFQTGACLKVLRAPRPYEGMDITDVGGLTVAQKDNLKLLGAIEDDSTPVSAL